MSNRIYVFGGEARSGTFDENEAYDPVTDSWEKLLPMPTPRHGLGAAIVGRTIYVIGGGISPGSSDPRSEVGHDKVTSAFTEVMKEAKLSAIR